MLMAYTNTDVFRVQLAEAIPVHGSGVTLPLDLHLIAARCHNSYYAPKKFSAVQLAYSEPRCRVLVFRKSALPRSFTPLLHRCIKPNPTHTVLTIP